jgi:peroxiredoxin
MNFETRYDRVLCLHAAAKRLQMPERTLRYRASRGWVQGAFKQGKLWKFLLPAIENTQRTPRRTLAAVALIAVAAVCLTTPAAAADAPRDAPNFTLSDSKGKPVNLSGYHGKVVLLDFWATWCHGCKLEIPWFMEFEKKYKHQGLTVVGVSMDEDGWKSVKPFVKEKKMNYPVVVGNDDLAKQYGLGSMPMTVLIGRDGKIAAKYDGVVDRDICEGQIRTLLQGRAR